MESLNCNDYSDDDEECEVEELPEWFVQEELYYSKLDSVNKFKHTIMAEAEFYGVKNISDVELLTFIEETTNSPKIVERKLTDYQYELFNDLHVVLFGTENSHTTYDKIASKIFKRCYI
tara:strand:+ start:574 stop:930 length:357 start_codon:yes stop_codon:yes gene_type:complete